MTRRPLDTPCTATTHGRESDYNSRGCRCPEARAAASASRVRRAERQATYGPVWIDGTGTARRLQALAAMSWHVTALAEHTGMNQDYISALRLGRPRVTQRIATVIAMTYQQLSRQDGGHPRTARVAARRGWLAPIDWLDVNIDDPNAEPDIDAYDDPDVYIDDIAVERACAGETITLTRLEKLAAAQILLRRGVGPQTIASQLHLAFHDVKSAAA